MPKICFCSFIETSLLFLSAIGAVLQEIVFGKYLRKCHREEIRKWWNGERKDYPIYFVIVFFCFSLIGTAHAKVVTEQCDEYGCVVHTSYAPGEQADSDEQWKQEMVARREAQMAIDFAREPNLNQAEIRADWEKGKKIIFSAPTRDEDSFAGSAMPVTRIVEQPIAIQASWSAEEINNYTQRGIVPQVVNQSSQGTQVEVVDATPKQEAPKTNGFQKALISKEGGSQ